VWPEQPPTVGAGASGRPADDSVDHPAAIDHRTEIARLTIVVSGDVQGVGFRDYVRTRGRRMGLVGTATNLAGGRVEIVAEGSRTVCEELLEMVRSGHTPGRTDAVSERWSPPRGGLSGFTRH
jgi:acylphosphatase